MRVMDKAVLERFPILEKFVERLVVVEDEPTNPDVPHRPDNIPATWIVFNAARPIAGDYHWQGPFKQGVFYAAVDPDGPGAAKRIEDNLSLDAAIVVFMYREDLDRMVDQWLYDYLDRMDLKLNPFDLSRRDIERSYFEQRRHWIDRVRKSR